jgi:hypothetical protein
MPSTPKIEKIFQELELQAKIDESKPEEQLIKEKIHFMKKQFISLRKITVILSNLYLVLLVASIIFIYVFIVQENYFVAVLDAIWFVMLLRNLLDTYFYIRVYGSEMKMQEIRVEQNRVEKKVEN